ncbi:MAG: hypothetical protein KAS94_00370 [Desulfobulbaceae bacterium]|nr:hypothetical protein [Desulfobulbaceae bacterium]
MPATHRIDKKNQLIFTRWEGEIEDAEGIAALKKYQKDIQCLPDCVDYNEVVDFSKVSDLKLTVEGVKILGQIASITDQDGVNRKLAFIVSSKLAYGLARMYEAFRSLVKNQHKEIRIFRKENDALFWAQK